MPHHTVNNGACILHTKQQRRQQGDVVCFLKQACHTTQSTTGHAGRTCLLAAGAAGAAAAAAAAAVMQHCTVNNGACSTGTAQHMQQQPNINQEACRMAAQSMQTRSQAASDPARTKGNPGPAPLTELHSRLVARTLPARSNDLAQNKRSREPPTCILVALVLLLQVR
jgi:hypothetical protein